MKIIEWLKASSVIVKFEVLEYKVFHGGFYIKLKADIKDDTTLAISEYSDKNERNYSYHWQDSRGKLICRWDNSPHHKSINSYPHHKHESNEVLESNEMCL